MSDIVTFGGYTFPSVKSLVHNFGDSVPKTIRVPGMDGGYSNYGWKRPPSEIGKVTVTFTLVSQTQIDMYTRRDAVLAPAANGKQKLVWTPDGSSTERWCYAVMNAAPMVVTLDRLPNLFHEISLTFQVDDPFWYVNLDNTFILGTSVLGGSDVLGGGVNATVTTSHDFSIATTGIADSYPILSVQVPAGKQVSNPRFELFNSLIDAGFYYAGTLTAGDLLMIDCRRRKIKLNGADAYANLVFTKQRGRWMKLFPGSNTLSVHFATPGDEATVAIQYREVFI